MDYTYDHPGKGLSLSQLVFALNEELKNAARSSSYVTKDHWTRSRGPEERRADFFCSLTFGDVSQLDKDTAIALATIREWRNSFVRINHVPLDILSLIPTHLPQKDRFRASFVCRHWRRTFLQHAALWSRLSLSKGEVYVKTLLERAKGSALEITTSCTDPVGTVTLFPPHAAQIRYLYFEYSHWADIQRFSEVNPGPLPLLHALRIRAVDEFSLDGPDVMTPPSLPLFTSAVNLKVFSLFSERSPFLSHFVFPNLTTFELSASPAAEGFRPSQLLDFLEASPMLRTVGVKVVADILLEDVPRERVVLLPNVEVFSLVVSDGGPGYEIATHISCPSAKSTSLIQEKNAQNATPRDIFPAPLSWNAIVRQYGRGPVESVSLELTFTFETIIACSIMFQSPDASFLRLCFKIDASREEEDMLQTPLHEMHHDAFYQAFRTIRDHPLLESVKRLNIKHRVRVFGSEQFPRMSSEVGRLYRSLPHLEELSIFGCDMQLYFNSPLNPPESQAMEQPVVPPPVRVLKISHPSHPENKEARMAAIVELAKSRHTLGIPFERVEVYMERLPTVMAERLGPWVGAADCREEMEPDDYY